jgi:predicted ATPase/class 3 adenylate cyclase/DNA-binding CsgD family transcriptional regulator
LTDVERSTSLWEAHGPAMGGAMARCHQLVAELVARHRGVRPEEQGEGDSAVAAFAWASDAVACALDLQRALADEAWPAEAVLRVRVAVHTGEAVLRDSRNYTGPSIHRCARLRGIAHGGQTLISQSTHELVVDSLPEGASLRDLGEHRLRDLERAEHVYQLCGPGLPDEFPPLRSLSAVPNNLPVALSSFVGRESEIAQTGELLAVSRLLTLTGAGGAGKTRLALQLAAGALADHPGGVWWVELAPLQDPALIGTTLAEALGVRPLPGQTDTDAAIAHLSAREALVVLDNCEHLLADTGRLVEGLLRGCPRVRVLATSRQPLRVEGETEWRVPSLSLPAKFDQQPGEPALRSDAIRLFVERAGQARASFRPTSANDRAVVSICRDLDGIPLALELAAARVRLLSVEQIAAGLADSLRLLSRGARTAALPRQQTLRASIDWSYELLEDREGMLFRRLGVFLGGFTLEAAEQVCADDVLRALEVLDLLGSLVEKSLVQAEEQGSAVRYRLLETVRQYALERLAEAGELDAARGRHRDVFLSFAERLAAETFGPGQPRVLAQLDLEASNLRAAFEHAVASDGELALRLSVAIAPWWRARARYHEAEDAYARALTTPTDREVSLLRSSALSARAWVVSNSGRYPRAVAYGEQALAEAEALGVPAAVIGALLSLGNAQFWGDPRGAHQTLVRARELALGTGDEWALARSEMLITIAAASCQDADLHRQYAEGLPARLERLGDVETLAAYWLFMSYLEYVAGELPRAREARERTLAAARAIDEPNLQLVALMQAAWEDIALGRAELALADLRLLEARAVERGLVAVPWLTFSRAMAEAACGKLDTAASRLVALLENQAGGALDALMSATTVLGEVLRLQRDDRAQACATRGLELARSVDSRWYAARNRVTLGRIAAACGDWAPAEQLHHEALEAIVDRGFRLELPFALEALAEVACGLESYSEAARILGAGERARRQLGLVAWPGQRAEVDALATRLRDALGEDAFNEARSDGAELGQQEAVAWIRRARGSRKRPTSGWESLTPTELEIVRHIAAGLTNPQVAARMFVSRSTVKTHLAHIFAKLDIRTRSDLAAQATQRLPPLEK